jgi:hypothetical protein
VKEEHKKNIEKMHFSCRKEPKCEEGKKLVKPQQCSVQQCNVVYNDCLLLHSILVFLTANDYDVSDENCTNQSCPTFSSFLLNRKSCHSK